LLLDVFAILFYFVVYMLWNLVCCSSCNANTHIKSWSWRVASWIFFFGGMQDLLEGVKRAHGKGTR
jgi:hypothetical protein